MSVRAQYLALGLLGVLAIAPTINEASAQGIDATLAIGETNRTAYGFDYPAAASDSSAALYALRVPVVGDLRVSFTGFDIDAGEVRLSVNGVGVAALPASADGGTRSYIYTIPAEILQRDNVLALELVDGVPTRWGVRNVRVTYVTAPACEFRPASGAVIREIPPGDWHLIGAGGYYCPLDVRDIQGLDEADKGVLWVLFAYRDGSYVQADVLEPGEGAWIKHFYDEPLRFAP